MKELIKGSVKVARGRPNPHDFEILGADGETYFAHLGDIKANEEELYKNPKAILQEEDAVEFEVVKASTSLRAIHIRKV